MTRTARLAMLMLGLSVLTNVNLFAQPGHIGVITTDFLRVRTAPNLSGNQLGFLNTNDQVTILGETSKTETIDNLTAPWYHIRTAKGLEGWVFGGYVRTSLAGASDRGELGTQQAGSYEDLSDVQKNLMASLEKPFDYSFPVMLAARKPQPDLHLSPEERAFYDRYAGIYAEKSDIESPNLDLDMHELDRGGWFGKWPDLEIGYDSNDKAFYEASGGCAFDISDLNSFAIPKGMVRVSGPRGPGRSIEDLVGRKRKDSDLSTQWKLTPEQESSLRSFVKQLFLNAFRGNTQHFIDSISRLYGLRINDIDSHVLNSVQLSEAATLLRVDQVNDSSLTFKPYLNVFFSERRRTFDRLYKNAAMLELKDLSDPVSYVALGVTFEHQKWKLVYLRTERDEE